MFVLVFLCCSLRSRQKRNKIVVEGSEEAVRRDQMVKFGGHLIQILE